MLLVRKREDKDQAERNPNHHSKEKGNVVRETSPSELPKAFGRAVSPFVVALPVPYARAIGSSIKQAQERR